MRKTKKICWPRHVLINIFSQRRFDDVEFFRKQQIPETWRQKNVPFVYFSVGVIFVEPTVDREKIFLTRFFVELEFFDQRANFFDRIKILKRKILFGRNFVRFYFLRIAKKIAKFFVVHPDLFDRRFEPIFRISESEMFFFVFSFRFDFSSNFFINSKSSFRCVNKWKNSMNSSGLSKPSRVLSAFWTRKKMQKKKFSFSFFLTWKIFSKNSVGIRTFKQSVNNFRHSRFVKVFEPSLSAARKWFKIQLVERRKSFSFAEKTFSFSFVTFLLWSNRVEFSCRSVRSNVPSRESTNRTSNCPPPKGEFRADDFCKLSWKLDFPENAKKKIFSGARKNQRTSTSCTRPLLTSRPNVWARKPWRISVISLTLSEKQKRNEIRERNFSSFRYKFSFFDTFSSSRDKRWSFRVRRGRIRAQISCRLLSVFPTNFRFSVDEEFLRSTVDSFESNDKYDRRLQIYIWTLLIRIRRRTRPFLSFSAEWNQIEARQTKFYDRDVLKRENHFFSLSRPDRSKNIFKTFWINSAINYLISSSSIGQQKWFSRELSGTNGEISRTATINNKRKEKSVSLDQFLY